jgi:hypothetical protein
MRPIRRSTVEQSVSMAGVATPTTPRPQRANRLPAFGIYIREEAIRMIGHVEFGVRLIAKRADSRRSTNSVA